MASGALPPGFPAIPIDGHFIGMEDYQVTHQKPMP